MRTFGFACSLKKKSFSMWQCNWLPKRCKILENKRKQEHLVSVLKHRYHKGTNIWHFKRYPATTTNNIIWICKYCIWWAYIYVYSQSITTNIICPNNFLCKTVLACSCWDTCSCLLCQMIGRTAECIIIVTSRLSYPVCTNDEEASWKTNSDTDDWCPLLDAHS